MKMGGEKGVNSTGVQAFGWCRGNWELAWGAKDLWICQMLPSMQSSQGHIVKTYLKAYFPQKNLVVQYTPKFGASRKKKQFKN
jgi:hypothetical protein